MLTLACARKNILMRRRQRNHSGLQFLPVPIVAKLANKMHFGLRIAPRQRCCHCLICALQKHADTNSEREKPTLPPGSTYPEFGEALKVSPSFGSRSTKRQEIEGHGFDVNEAHTQFNKYICVNTSNNYNWFHFPVQGESFFGTRDTVSTSLDEFTANYELYIY